MSARADILARVMSAIGQAESVVVDRHYRKAAERPLQPAARADLLVERVNDYKAATIRCADTDEGIAEAVSAALAGRGVERVVVPAALPAAWLPAERRVVDDPPLSALELDRTSGVLTGCAVAMADTGTIVIDASARCGRRAITLIPDLHICVVRADQLVPSVPDAVAELDPRRPTTFISGPSATSDIELERVEGVHGPRQLVVIVATA